MLYYQYLYDLLLHAVLQLLGGFVEPPNDLLGSANHVSFLDGLGGIFFDLVKYFFQKIFFSEF